MTWIHWSVVLAGLAVAACTGEHAITATTARPPALTNPTQGSGRVIHVPGDAPGIQAAVDVAEPGDLVLVAAGTYHESVDIVTDRITLRGEDRNTVVLDGEQKLDNGVRVLGADGVVVENMTATGFTANGFFWTGVDGFRGSYLTSYRTGTYGIYAFDSVDGRLDHTYSAGSPDGGIYVGQCFPCSVVVTDAVSEFNAVGYFGTNSGGDLYVVDSVFRHNRIGVFVNSASYELCYPGRSTTLAGNVVADNNSTEAPSVSFFESVIGDGIIVSGGIGHRITRNLVSDHRNAGIAVLSFRELDPDDSVPARDTWDVPCSVQRTTAPVPPRHTVDWDSRDVRVEGNVVRRSGQADLLLGPAAAPPAEAGNCFTENQVSSTMPARLQELLACDRAPASADPADYAVVGYRPEPAKPPMGWADAAIPALVAQPSMPEARTAPVLPAGRPQFPDVAAIQVPEESK